jgi:hypothetical protein
MNHLEQGIMFCNNTTMYILLNLDCFYQFVIVGISDNRGYTSIRIIRTQNRRGGAEPLREKAQLFMQLFLPYSFLTDGC